jgi:hypothetical protein
LRKKSKPDYRLEIMRLASERKLPNPCSRKSTNHDFNGTCFELKKAGYIDGLEANTIVFDPKEETGFIDPETRQYVDSREEPWSITISGRDYLEKLESKTRKARLLQTLKYLIAALIGFAAPHFFEWLFN